MSTPTRDELAMAAMQGIISHPVTFGQIADIAKQSGFDRDAVVAKAAYEYADAMLAARETLKPETTDAQKAIQTAFQAVEHAYGIYCEKKNANSDIDLGSTAYDSLGRWLYEAAECLRQIRK